MKQEVRVAIALRRQCMLLSLVVLLAAACSSQQTPGSAPDIEETVLLIASRSTRIPATITLPQSGDEPRPLVVMAHGHGGSRSEAGSFDRLAAQLAGQGIASIRMDFPGCGDSSEAFSANNISAMLLDLAAARDYAVLHYPVDTDRIAVHGYSMGARIALLSSRDQQWAAISGWAPVVADGEESMLVFLNGRDSWNELRSEAETEGQASFVTRFGQSQTLGRRWFSDLAVSRPLQTAATYNRPVLALCGKHDDIAPLSACQSVADSLQLAVVETHSIDADHGFGFYSGNPVAGDEVLRLTVGFFVRHLL